jgi:cytochrome P450
MRAVSHESPGDATAARSTSAAASRRIPRVTSPHAAPPAIPLDDPAFYLDEAATARAFAWLRREDPVHWFEPRGFWTLTRHADVQWASRAPELFCSSQHLAMPRAGQRDASHVEGIPPSIIQMDPPDHNRHRRLVSQAFTPRVVARLEERMRAIAVESVSAVPTGEPVDFVEAVAVPLPLRVIAEMLGVPDSDLDQFRRWSDAIVVQAGAEQDLETAGAMMAELFGYFQQRLEERRRTPREDLLSALAAAEVEGQRLDDLEILIFCMTLLVAGNETTRTLIAQGTRLLLEQPDQLALVRDGIVPLPDAIEEMLRVVPPIRSFFRTATRAIERHGRHIVEGDPVMLLYPAANRDETVWGPDADRFDVRRPPQPHLAFGFGQHFCLGANLARQEARVLFEELFARRPHFEPAGPIEYTRSTFVSGIDRMPVQFR